MSALLATLVIVAAPDAIVRVVVYPDRAQVVRAQTVACGHHVAAAFGAIPPAADPASVRVVSREATVDGLRTEEHTRQSEFAPQLAQVDAQIDELSERLAELRDARTGEEQTGRLGERYAAVTGSLIDREMATGPAAVRAWDAALELLLKQRLAGAAEQVALSARARTLEQRLAELRRRRATLAGAAGRREYSAEARLSCPAGGTARVELSYLVGGASWQPAYEARAQEAAGTVELSTWATVVQTTGEDWKDVQLTLSTAIARQEATPPDLSPLKVWAEERTPPRKVLVSNQSYQEHAAPEPGSSASTGGLRTEEQGLSVQLVVPQPAEVPGDGSAARLLVGRRAQKAPLRYRAAPKWAPLVFRVAELHDDAPYPLLPGPIDVYRRGQFVARYQLERVASGARFYLTFGLEEHLRARRTVLEEVVRDRGYLGRTRRHRYAYRFEVANYLGRPEEIEVSDHIPVSELDDVKVEIDGQTTGGYRLAGDDGIVSWRVALRPGERRYLELRYHVDAPQSYDAGD
jgi:uncharacterized protein (TIGR02231 family)